VQPRSAFFLDDNYKPGANLIIPAATIHLHSGQQGSMQLRPNGPIATLP
jgi:hypothetical protein